MQGPANNTLFSNNNQNNIGDSNGRIMEAIREVHNTVTEGFEKTNSLLRHEI